MNFPWYQRGLWAVSEPSEESLPRGDEGDETIGEKQITVGEKQIGRLMKCLISSAPVSRAGQVDPMSAHLQMVEAELEVLYYVPFYPSRGLRRTKGPLDRL